MSLPQLLAGDHTRVCSLLSVTFGDRHPWTFLAAGLLQGGVTRCRLGSEEGWSLNWGRCIGPDGLHVLDGVHFTVGS